MTSNIQILLCSKHFVLELAELVLELLKKFSSIFFALIPSFILFDIHAFLF